MWGKSKNYIPFVLISEVGGGAVVSGEFKPKLRSVKWTVVRIDIFMN